MGPSPSSAPESAQPDKSQDGTAAAAAAQHRALSISPKASDAVDPELLANLIQSAREVGQRCDGLLAQCRAHEEKVEHASIDLQDRLQLGARMLKAFQTQINQLQAMFTQLRNRQQQAQSSEAALRQSLDRFDEHVEAAKKQLDERIEQAVLAAIARIDHAASIRSQAAALAQASGATASRSELTELSTLLHDAAHRISELAGTEASPDAASRSDRPDSVIESKPKSNSVEAPAQPPLRLHA